MLTRGIKSDLRNLSEPLGVRGVHGIDSVWMGTRHEEEDNMA